MKKILIVWAIAVCLSGTPVLSPKGTAVDAQAVSFCGLASPAFCATAFSPASIGNRSGQLNGTLWGVSRTTGNTNPGSDNDAWAIPSNQNQCGTTVAVQPDKDVNICNGMIVESTNDGGSIGQGTVTTLAMYPKQPFDFAGRTGKITFDVSDDSQGTHAAWPEFWLTDKPVPAPFAHEGSWQALPPNGFGIRFGAECPANTGCGSCPVSPVTTVGVDSAITINNFVANDSFNGGSLQVHNDQCVAEPTAPGQLNHFEIDVSTSQIDVYGTDAGTTAPLKHLAAINNFGTLGLTRGLVWLEDVHYNACKFNTQCDHTFTWDNIGFDGPLLPRDLTFDVLDNLTTAGPGLVNLGWNIPQGQTQSLTIPNVSGIGQAQAAYILLNFFSEQAGFNITYKLNNGPLHTMSWPYPDQQTFTWRTIAMPIAATEAQTGSNTLTIGGSGSFVAANIDLLLAGAGGTVPCNCGSGTPPPTATPTATPTQIPSGTPTQSPPPTSSPTVTPIPTATVTSSPAASSFTTGATETPSPLQAGGIGKLTVTTTNTSVDGSTSALVDVEVYDPSDNKVFQQYWDSQSFATAQTLTFNASWSVPAGATLGTYTVKVGVFSVGWGTVYAWNGTASQFTVSGASVGATVPGAPTAVNATAGNGQVAVAWSAPASNGGSPITSYTVTSIPSGGIATINGMSATVSNLTNNQAYLFTVAAVNKAGTGPIAISNSVTPTAAPTTMTVDVVILTGSSSVSYSIAAQVGGTPCGNPTNVPWATFVVMTLNCGAAGQPVTFTANGGSAGIDVASTGASCLTITGGATSVVIVYPGQSQNTSCGSAAGPAPAGDVELADWWKIAAPLLRFSSTVR